MIKKASQNVCYCSRLCSRRIANGSPLGQHSSTCPSGQSTQRRRYWLGRVPPAGQARRRCPCSTAVAAAPAATACLSNAGLVGRAAGLRPQGWRQGWRPGCHAGMQRLKRPAGSGWFPPCARPRGWQGRQTIHGGHACSKKVRGHTRDPVWEASGMQAGPGMTRVGGKQRSRQSINGGHACRQKARRNTWCRLARHDPAGRQAAQQAVQLEQCTAQSAPNSLPRTAAIVVSTPQSNVSASCANRSRCCQVAC